MVATRGSHGIRKPKTYHNGSAKAIEVVAPELPPPPVAQSPTDDENAAPPPPPLPSSGGSRNAIAYSPSKKARRSSMAFAPICVFSPNEGTPPMIHVPKTPVLGSAIKASGGMRRLSNGSCLSCACTKSLAASFRHAAHAPRSIHARTGRSDVLSPPKSREKLHKRARGLSDAALEEAEA